MNALLFKPVSAFDRQIPRSRADTGNRPGDSSQSRRRTAQRRSGTADRRRLQTDYPNCRRKQVADRRRMNGDRRYAYSKHQGSQPIRTKFPNLPEIRKGQLIDIAV